MPGSSLPLAVMNHAATKVAVQISVWVSVFSLTLDVDLLGHTIILCLHFERPFPTLWHLFSWIFFFCLCALYTYIPAVFLNISFPPMSEKLAFDDEIKGTPQPLRSISMWSKTLQILKENVAIEWWISLGTNSLTDPPIIHPFTKYQKVFFFFIEFVGKPYLKPIKNVHVCTFISNSSKYRVAHNQVLHFVGL